MAERGERSSWSVNKTDLVTSLAEYLNLKHTRTHTHTHTHLVSSLHLGKIEATRPVTSRSRVEEHREYHQNPKSLTDSIEPSNLLFLQYKCHDFSIFIHHFHGKLVVWVGGLNIWDPLHERGLLLTSGTPKKESNFYHPLSEFPYHFPKLSQELHHFFGGGKIIENPHPKTCLIRGFGPKPCKKLVSVSAPHEPISGLPASPCS